MTKPALTAEEILILLNDGWNISRDPSRNNHWVLMRDDEICPMKCCKSTLGMMVNKGMLNKTEDGYSPPIPGAVNHNPIFDNIYTRRDIQIEVLEPDFSKFAIKQGDQVIIVDGGFFIDAKMVLDRAALANPGELGVRIFNTLPTSNNLPTMSWD